MPARLPPDAAGRQHRVQRMTQHMPAIDRQFALEDEIRLVEQKEIVAAQDEGVVHIERDERRRNRDEAQPADAEYAAQRREGSHRLGRERAQPIARMPGAAQAHVDDDEIVAPGPHVGHRPQEARGGAVEILRSVEQRRAPSGPQQRGALGILVFHVMKIADLEDSRRRRHGFAHPTGRPRRELIARARGAAAARSSPRACRRRRSRPRSGRPPRWRPRRRACR